MRAKSAGWCVTMGLICLLALAGSAGAIEVPLTVTESAGVDRTDEPVTTGVPFARGVLKDVKSLMLKDEAGKTLPGQFRVLANWPDGSARVVLVDTQVTVPANGTAKLTLSDGAPRVQIQGGQINIQGGQVKIQAGAAVQGGGQVKMEVRVQAGGDGPVEQVIIVDGQRIDPATGLPMAAAGGQLGFEDGPEAITLNTGPLELTVSKKKFNLFQSLKANGKELLAAGGARIVLTTDDGKQVTAGDVAPTEVKLEEIGPLRAVICAKGRLADVHKKLIGYTCRITAYAGKPYVKVTLWLENDGKYGYTGQGEWFVFDGLSVELPLKACVVKCEGADASAKAFELQQKNETGKGDWKAFKYTLAGANTLPDGERASGRIAVESDNGTATVVVKDFWQNYPKGLRVTDGTLALDLWPTWGQWPRPCPGSKCGEGVRKADRYVLPGGVRKRHEMILEFASPPRPVAATAATLDQPLMALATPAYCADTEALGLFAPGDFKPADAASAGLVERWNTWARNCADPNHPRGVEGTRKSCTYGPFYGWMDFGELFWDPGTCQLHYDWTWVMLLDYVRLGERNFLDRAAEMAFHRIDVDQLWTDRDMPLFNHLTRYEKGFADIHAGAKDGHYKPITSHNWVRGVVWWYYLTGDASAYECALKNAQGVKARQVDAHAKADRLGDQPRCSSWAIECLVDVYDLTADKQYLDQAMTLWNNHLKPLWKEKGAHFGLTGGNVLQYYYGAGPLVMLHQRTGDAELLQYIRDLCKHCDDPAVWTTYADDMASNMNNCYGYLAAVDKDASKLARARQLFADAMKKDNGLVLWGGSGAYTKEVAKKLRNGHIWLWAERKLARAN